MQGCDVYERLGVSAQDGCLRDAGVGRFTVICGIYVTGRRGSGEVTQTLTPSSAVRLAAKRCQPNTSERSGRSSRGIWIVKLH